jgi:hypothetical protein
MQRKKTTQMMIVPERAGFSGNVSTRKNAAGSQIFADKSVPKIAIASRPAFLPISETQLLPI